MKKAIACLLLFTLLFTTPAMATQSQIKQVLSTAMEQLGKPYDLFSDAPNSFNCCSFVMYCFNRVSNGTISNGRIKGNYEKVTSMKKLRPGDIVCFKGSKQQKGILGYHFGIYMGRGYFINAKNKREGVTVSKVKDYKKRFVGAIRVF